MDFSQALLEIKAGKKVCRKNSDMEKNNLFIKLLTTLPFTDSTITSNVIVVCNLHDGSIVANAIQSLSGGPTIDANTSNTLYLDTSSYLATSPALLSEDWYVVE